MQSAPTITAETIYSGDINGLRADARGASSLLAHQQLGTIAMPTNPTNGQTLTLTVNSTAIVITFVTSIGAAANNVLIGSSAAVTAQNLYNFLTNPSLTSTTQVAATAGNQTLLSYLCVGTATTNTVLGSNNKTIYAPLTTLTGSTTVTGASYTASTVKVYVEPGNVWVNGVLVKFAGASSPAVTAPSANPRIDVLTMDNTGTLAWTVGTENASPFAPTYPVNKIPICEIRSVVSQTIINDFENQISTQAYILNDVRPMVQTPVPLGAIAADILPDADATRNLGSATFEWNNIYAKNQVFVNGVGVASAKFGGTGTDGALSISSGTTTIACGSAAIIEKNYTSVSITGTANIAFSGPNNTTGTTAYLRSQGAWTMTSSSSTVIDLRNMGGGISTGHAGQLIFTQAASGGGAGGGGGGSGSGAGGDASAPGTSTGGVPGMGGVNSPIYPWSRYVSPGGNGGSGAAGSSNGGSGSGGGGGLGAGGLVIECNGAYNFTSGTINGVGANGSNGGATSGGAVGQGAGGGGGGGGANVLVLCASITANTGTYTLTAGSGGSGASGNGGTNGSSGASGATGSSFVGVNKYFS